MPPDAFGKAFWLARLFGKPVLANGATLPICAALVAPEAIRRPRFKGAGTMIYILALFLPPLALLFNGQPFAAIFNLVLIVPCLLLGLVFHVLWLVPSAHAVIAIYHERENRRHREIVEAIERHGAPPGWR